MERQKSKHEKKGDKKNPPRIKHPKQQQQQRNELI